MAWGGELMTGAAQAQHAVGRRHHHGLALGARRRRWWTIATPRRRVDQRIRVARQRDGARQPDEVEQQFAVEAGAVEMALLETLGWLEAAGVVRDADGRQFEVAERCAVLQAQLAQRAAQFVQAPGPASLRTARSGARGSRRGRTRRTAGRAETCRSRGRTCRAAPPRPRSPAPGPPQPSSAWCAIANISSPRGRAKLALEPGKAAAALSASSVSPTHSARMRGVGVPLRRSTGQMWPVSQAGDGGDRIHRQRRAGQQRSDPRLEQS